MVGACQCYADAKAEARVHEQAESQAATAPVGHEERRRLFYGPPDGSPGFERDPSPNCARGRSTTRRFGLAYFYFRCA